MYHGYLNVSGVPVVLGGTCLCQRYTRLFQEDLHVYVRGTCMFVSGVPV